MLSLSLFQEELTQRPDSFKHVIANTQEEACLITKLKSLDAVSGESYFITAMYLGLLGDIGLKLSKKNFTQFITDHFEEIQENCSMDSIRVWCSLLEETTQNTLLEAMKIPEVAEPSPPSPTLDMTQLPLDPTGMASEIYEYEVLIRKWLQQNGLPKEVRNSPRVSEFPGGFLHVTSSVFTPPTTYCI